VRKSALKAVRPSAPLASSWAAMLGADAAGPHGAAMAKLVATCASVRPTYAAVAQGELNQVMRADLLARQRRAERKLKRWAAPRLAALLWEGLADLNPAQAEQLAAIVRAVRDHWHDSDRSSHALPFHSRALALAGTIRAEEGLAGLHRRRRLWGPRWKGKPLPIARDDFLRRLGIEAKEHDAQSYYRRELRRLGFRFARRTKETRKRST